jgi:hypothetical protein
MPVTVRNTDILFNDATTQSSAGITLANAAGLGVGAKIMAFYYSTTALGMGGDVSGAGLFRNTGGQASHYIGTFQDGTLSNFDARNRTATFTVSGVTYTSIGVGTWRLLGPVHHLGTTYYFDSYGTVTQRISLGLYVRVA